MRTGAASAVGARRHNEDDVTMTIAGFWRYGDWLIQESTVTSLIWERASFLRPTIMLLICYIYGRPME